MLSAVFSRMWSQMCGRNEARMVVVLKFKYRVFIEFLLSFHWAAISYGYLMVILRLSYGYPTVRAVEKSCKLNGLFC